MALATTTSAQGKWKLLVGTAQEVADGLDSMAIGAVSGFHYDGTSYHVLVKNISA